MTFPASPTFQTKFKRPLVSRFPAAPTFPSSGPPNPDPLFGIPLVARFQLTYLQTTFNAFQGGVAQTTVDLHGNQLLFQDIGNTVPSINPGDLVKSVYDPISGLSLALSGSTITLQFEFNAFGIRCPFLSGGYLLCSFSIPGALTRISTFQMNALSIGGVSDIVFDGSSELNCTLDINSAPSTLMVAGSAITYSVAAANSSYAVVTEIYNGASSAMRVNGTQVASGDTGSNNHSGLSVGAFPDGTRQSNLNFSAVLVSSGVMSSTNYQKCENYLSLFFNAVIPSLYPNAFLFIGDSQTVGVGCTSLNAAGTTVSQFTSTQLINCGISGSLSPNWTTGSDYFNRAVSRANGVPKLALILLGANDANIQNATSESDYQSYLANTISGLFVAIPSLTAVVLNCPAYIVPGSDGGNFDSSSLILLQAYRTAILKLYNGTTILLGDITAYEHVEANQDLLTDDGVHLNQAGQTWQGNAWATALKTGYPQISLIDFNGQTGANYVTGAAGLYFNFYDQVSNVFSPWFTTGTEFNPGGGGGPGTEVQVVITALSSASDIASALASAWNGMFSTTATATVVNGGGTNSAVQFTLTVNAPTTDAADVNTGAAVSTIQVGQAPL